MGSVSQNILVVFTSKRHVFKFFLLRICLYGLKVVREFLSLLYNQFLFGIEVYAYFLSFGSTSAVAKIGELPSLAAIFYSAAILYILFCYYFLYFILLLFLIFYSVAIFYILFCCYFLYFILLLFFVFYSVVIFCILFRCYSSYFIPLLFFIFYSVVIFHIFFYILFYFSSSFFGISKNKRLQWCKIFSWWVTLSPSL